MLRTLFVCLVALLAFPLLLRAQVPSGGYAPHRVTRLARVPEPPGGLVPYRKGKLWGYADTTGRVVIAPRFGREPRPFILGFGILTHSPLTLINARGEVLRASGSRAIGFAAGGFALVARRGVGFRPALAELRYPKDGREAVADTAWLSPRNNDDDRISPTRGLRFKNSSLWGRYSKFLSMYPEYARGALTNEHGRRLTGYSYSEIYPWQAGLLVGVRTGSRSTVLLNRRGQVVSPPNAYRCRLYNNRTLVDSPLETGEKDIVDSTGHLINTLATNGSAGWLVPGEVFVTVRPLGLGFIHFYDRNGQPLLGGQEFRQMGQFWNNRLWVRTMDGKEGLLDRHLRWVVPPEYEAIYYRMIGGDREHALPRYKLDHFIYDSAYMVVRQHRRYGQVAVASGRVVIPTRYDSVITPLTKHFATLLREGQPYVLNSRGRELTPGRTSQWSYPECRDGNCRAGVVRGDQSALFDTTGRQLCPWRAVLPASYQGGYQAVARYGYDSLAIVYQVPPLINGRSNDYDQRVNLITRAGQLQLPWHYQDIRVGGGYYGLKFNSQPGQNTTQWVLFDRRLRPVATHPFSELRYFPGGWLSTGTEMFQEDGRRVAVPNPARQQFSNSIYSLPEEPFFRGFWRVEWDEPMLVPRNYAGYITIHGRALWED